MEYRAALFASRGYASLSLAYIGHKELPAPHNRMNVGDSYFKVKYPALSVGVTLLAFLLLFIYFWTESIPATSGSSSGLC